MTVRRAEVNQAPVCERQQDSSGQQLDDVFHDTAFEQDICREKADIYSSVSCQVNIKRLKYSASTARTACPLGPSKIEECPCPTSPPHRADRGRPSSSLLHVPAQTILNHQQYHFAGHQDLPDLTFEPFQSFVRKADERDWA